MSWLDPIPEIIDSSRGEQGKAFARRRREGWFQRYLQAPLIDIGSGPDPLLPWMLGHPNYRTWDIPQGDATYMLGVEDKSYATVVASHILEHLDFPHFALINWWRILRPGGWLIVDVPHRGLYERQLILPSRWAPEHKTLWLPEKSDHETSYTYGLREFLSSPELLGPHTPTFEIEVLDYGYQPVPLDVHPRGEYAIEARVYKP